MGEFGLRLKRHYSIVAHSPDLVELRHGVWNPESYTFRDDAGSGRLFRIMKRLDGTAAPSQIAREEDVPLEDVEGLIDHLQTLGVLESSATTALDHYIDTLVPWRSDGARSTQTVLQLGDAEPTTAIADYLRASLPDVEMRVLGADDPVRRLITSLSGPELLDGLAFEEALEVADGWRDSFVIHASSVIDPVELRIVNRICLGLAVPWLHAALDGPFVLVGPLVVPQRSPCYECLETRVTMNMRERASYQQYKEALAELAVAPGGMPAHPIMVGMLASHASLEALNFLATGSTFTINKLLAIYLPTMEVAYNEVLRVPSCPACSPTPEQQETSLYFDTGALLVEPTGRSAADG